MVYDYLDGEADWLAFGLPTAGKQANKRRAGMVADRDAPTCALSEGISQVRERLAGSAWDCCVVIDPEGIVHGRLHADALTDDPDGGVERAMQAGPATVRPSEDLEELVGRMREHDVDSMIVTTSDGRLVGVLRRLEAERVLAVGDVAAG